MYLGLAALLCAGAAIADAAAEGAPWGERWFVPGATRETAKPKAGPAAVPTIRDIEALEGALNEAWERMPLTQRRAVFVANKPLLYGGYEERTSIVFAPGEKLVTYVEPMGYAWVPAGAGYQFGITMDFVIKNAEGKVLAGQDAFQTFSFTSRFKNREVYANVTLTLDGLPPGDYRVVYTLHDTGSAKTSSFEQPFIIASKT